MGLIDNIMLALSPRRAYERQAWRNAHDEIRNYDAGKDDRLNYGWRTTNLTGEQTDAAYRDTIRARARDLERNSDMFNGIVLSMVRNTVGKGFNLQAKTDDDELNDRIEQLFRQWANSTDCDATNRESFQSLTRMILTRKIVDGGILIVKVFNKHKKIPLQLQLVEVDALDIMRIAPKYKKNTVVAGIEINEFGRPAGYWIKTNNNTYSNDSRFYPSTDVIYYAHRTRPTQVREMSQAATTISRIRDMNSYMEAVSVKERVAACLSVFITKAVPNPVYGRESGLKDKDTRYKGLKLTPGMIKELQPGESIEAVAPANQGGGANEFMRLQQRLAGAGLGLSYETTSRDMSQVNYSSARQGLIEDEATYNIEREILINTVLKNIYAAFVESALLSGALSIDGYWLDKDKYLAHEWIPPGRRWIDPLKEANANKTAMETGQRTFGEIVAEQGHDWKEQIDEMAKIKQYAQEKGVALFGET